jgi:hypothetical protein
LLLCYETVCYPLSSSRFVDWTRFLSCQSYEAFNVCLLELGIH